MKIKENCNNFAIKSHWHPEVFIIQYCSKYWSVLRIIYFIIIKQSETIITSTHLWTFLPMGYTILETSAFCLNLLSAYTLLIFIAVLPYYLDIDFFYSALPKPSRHCFLKQFFSTENTNGKCANTIKACKN